MTTWTTTSNVKWNELMERAFQGDDVSYSLETWSESDQELKASWSIVSAVGPVLILSYMAIITLIVQRSKQQLSSITPGRPLQ